MAFSSPKLSSAAVAVFAVLALAIAAASAMQTTSVDAPCGTIVGEMASEARIFRGIPFAAPPVGDLRWEAPVAAAPFKTPYQALADGPGCWQDCQLPPHTCPPVMSEDCLIMNIFTPRPEALMNKKVPVLLFVHGGNFKQGYAGGPLYDGTHFANRTEVITVVIQYRLGALGFLYSETSGGSISGNFGMLDQKLALEWVQTNIGAFGGDADSVMVFGQSAGAMSVGVQLVSPDFEGLFKYALMESNPFGLVYRTPETWAGVPKALATDLGCAKSSDYDACLRAADASALTAAQVKVEKDLLTDLKNILQVFLPWTPTVGTDLLPYHPLHGFQRGQIKKNPFTIGTVQNEALVFVWEAFTKPLSHLEYDIILGIIFGVENAIKITEQYPLPSNETADARKNAALIATHGLFVCPTRNATLSNGGNQPHVYHFDHIMSFGKAAWGPMFPECDDEVCHAGELPFVWAINGTSFGMQMDPEEVVMSNSMETFWANMATTGSPGTAEGIAWPEFMLGNEQSMLIQTPKNEVQKNAYADICGFWDSLGYTWVKN